MDKRWIIILIFLIVGCCCLFYVVETSPTVGNAITVINKTTVTLPNEFSIESKTSYGTLINKNTKEKITIKDLGKDNSALNKFKNALTDLTKNPDIANVKNSTLNINNITAYKIDYQDITKENNSDLSRVYVFTCNHTFLIKLENYNNNTRLNMNLDYVITHMVPDFKQSQD